MFDLTGKTALVTGASSGLGLAIARTLHKAGATVGLSGTRREALEALASELKERAHILPCNLSDRADTDKLIPAAEAAMGGVEILVNNAGITRDMLFMRMKDEDWDAVLAVNLTAAFRLSRAVLRGMMRKRYGRIINITSVAGAVGNPGQANYTAAKAGLTGMTKSLANEVASRGITVNCVAPGAVLVERTSKELPDYAGTFARMTPLGRVGEAPGQQRRLQRGAVRGEGGSEHTGRADELRRLLGAEPTQVLLPETQGARLVHLGQQRIVRVLGRLVRPRVHGSRARLTRPD